MIISPKKTRNTTIELLRFFFMFCIVVSHVYGHGSRLNYEWIYSLGSEFGTAIHLGIFSLGKIGVTGFMFISGYYGIKLTPKKFFSLLAIVLFYTIILYGRNGLITIFTPYSNWWFVESYLLVMLISPAIDVLLTKIDSKISLMIVFALTYYEYIGLFLSCANSHDLAFLLSVYIIARYIAITKTNKDISSLKNNYTSLKCLESLKVILGGGGKVLIYKKLAVLLLIVIFFVPIIMSYMEFPFKLFKLWFTNNNILYLLLSAVLVLSADTTYTYNKLINYFSSSILSIYLITDSSLLRQPIDEWLLPNLLNGIGFLYAFLLCLTCLLVDKIREMLFKFLKIN